jgi:hypothetical protein
MVGDDKTTGGDSHATLPNAKDFPWLDLHKQTATDWIVIYLETQLSRGSHHDFPRDGAYLKTPLMTA